jgi:hypothetical protein
LPSEEFTRVHHSCILALKRVEKVHRNEVRVAGTLVPVRDTYGGAFEALVERRVKVRYRRKFVQ